MAAAGIVAASIFIAYYQLVGSVPPSRSRVEIVAKNVVIAAVGIALATAVSNEWVKRRLEPVWSDIAGCTASLATYEALLRQPGRIARLVLGLWLLPAFVSPIDDVVAAHYKAGPPSSWVSVSVRWPARRCCICWPSAAFARCSRAPLEGTGRP
jgi:hypothetical protein